VTNGAAIHPRLGMAGSSYRRWMNFRPARSTYDANGNLTQFNDALHNLTNYTAHGFVEHSIAFPRVTQMPLAGDWQRAGLARSVTMVAWQECCRRRPDCGAVANRTRLVVRA
jgi:hypothetical protein